MQCFALIVSNFIMQNYAYKYDTLQTKNSLIGIDYHYII